MLLSENVCLYKKQIIGFIRANIPLPNKLVKTNSKIPLISSNLMRSLNFALRKLVHWCKAAGGSMASDLATQSSALYVAF